MSDIYGTYDEADFSAELQFNGESINLHTTGAGTFPTPGYVISIVYGNQGINPDPDVVMLDVHEEQEAGVFTQVVTKKWASAGFDFRHAPKVVIFQLPDGRDVQIVFTIPD